MTTPHEVYTVHTWRFIEHRYLPARTFDTSPEAWAWVREQMDLGKDISRFRVIASESPHSRREGKGSRSINVPLHT